MVLVIHSGAFKVTCQHIQLKDNTHYYRRRIHLNAAKAMVLQSGNLKQNGCCHKADSETFRLGLSGKRCVLSSAFAFSYPFVVILDPHIRP
jgi:hypothetical protein